jgi:CheY-like chemotaxis protein
MAGKILIVEDNSRLAEILAVYLNEAGYETSWAANSAQGISKAITERPDLIVTDLNLPDMIAVEAITILKKIPITSRIPILSFAALSFTPCPSWLVAGCFSRRWSFFSSLNCCLNQWANSPVANSLP